MPTTVLAQQHYETFTERFANWPFEVGCYLNLNKNETIAGLKKRASERVIGTHHVLSKDVEFLDLRVLVVDENNDLAK